MNIRLYNAKILTLDPKKPIFDGEIWVKNEKIAYILEGDEVNEMRNEWRKEGMPTINWDMSLDCQGNLLMPGFKDAHTHSPMTFLRSFADDLPLQDWLNKKVFPMEALLTPDDIYELTKLAVLEYLSSGITAAFDMYINPDAVGHAFLDTGFKGTLVSGLNNFTSSPRQMEAEYIKWNKKGSPVNYHFGFHAEYTCSSDLLRKVADLAHHYKAPVYTHLAETESEVADCKKRNGVTPLVYLDNMGIFSFGGGAYHCVHMTKQDLDIMQFRRMIAVTNPASNLKLASGIAPIAEFMKRKIPVAIGTDGAASNNCLDMFREMFLVTALSKIRENDAASIDATEVLKMATTNGAKAMKRSRMSKLSKGRAADIIMIDLHQPNMQPINNIEKNIVYSGSKSNVKMTMVNGKIMYLDGKYNIGEEPEVIYERANGIVKRMISNI